MSKIKTSNVTPRTTGGSLTIGEPRSTTYFHKDSDVVIPGYATKDYVDEVASAAPHGNPVFHLNDNKLVRSYTIPEGKNAGTFGELEMDDNVDVHVPDGSTWTIVGNKEVGSDGTIALSDLVDTDIPMIPQPDAMLWYDEFSGKWKPKTISSLPQGEAGQDGEDGKSAYEIYAETTTDSPVKTVQEWLDSLQGADGEDGKDSLEVWLEKNPGSTEEDYWESMRGPIGPDGLSSFDLWLADNPGGTEEEYWASLEGPQGQPGPGFDYKGNVATEADLPNDSGNPNSDGDAYFVEDVGEIFAWGADDQWHSLGQIQGPQGDEGDKGETGDSAYEIWLKSNPGKTEQEFLDSLKGEQGETGEDGEDGLGQMVGVGSTVTLDAGESATVTQNPNLSTQEKIILDFGIPKGLDGIDGLPGNEGLPGADGASAYESWLAAGNSGSEQDFLDSIVGDTGEPGEDGLSAYEVAIENGFSGTEEEWLKSLVGEKGPQGDGIHVKGHVSDESQLPPTAEVGDAYGDDNGDLWIYSDDGMWVNFGHVQGPAGEDGEDGKSAYASALDAGFQGSEEEWIASLKGDEGEPGESIKGDPGDDGKSAYDIAVEQGFQGTEDQWLESLKGEDGLLDDETLAQIQDDLTQINSTLTPSSDGTVLTGHVTNNGDGTFTHTTSWEEVEHPDPGYTGGDLHVDGTFSAAHEGAGDAAIAIGQKGMYEGEGPAGEINQGWSAIAIGAGAGWKDQGDGGVAVGAVAAEISQGANGIAIGGGAGYNSQGEASISVGLNSGNGYQGRDSVSIGSNSGCKSQGARSVAVGKSAGYENQGQESIAIGSGAGLRSQPDNSIAIGKDSAPAAENSIQLKAGTTTFDVTPTEVLHNGQPIGGGDSTHTDNSHTDNTNVQVGEGALSKYTSDTYRQLQYNTVVGKDAFTDSYGQGNTAVGTRAGVSATGGSFNVGVGAEALEWTTTGSNNTALGAYALSHNPEGSHNVCIGYSNSFTLESGDNNIVIGSLADPSGENVSNEITLGSGYNDKFRVPGVGLEITKDAILHNGEPIGGGGDFDNSHTDDKNNVLLGKDAELSSPSVSNEITLGNGAIENLRVPGIGLDITKANDRDKKVNKKAIGGWRFGNSFDVYQGGIAFDSGDEMFLLARGNGSMIGFSNAGDDHSDLGRPYKEYDEASKTLTFFLDANAFPSMEIWFQPYPPIDIEHVVLDIERLTPGHPFFLSLNNNKDEDIPKISYKINGNSPYFSGLRPPSNLPAGAYVSSVAGCIYASGPFGGFYWHELKGPNARGVRMSDFVESLSEISNSTKNETTFEGLRDSLSTAIDGLISKFESQISD